MAITTAKMVAREAWPYLVLFALALAGAAVWGALWRPEPMPPLLGHVSVSLVSPPPPSRPAKPKP